MLPQSWKRFAAILIPTFTILYYIFFNILQFRERYPEVQDFLAVTIQDEVQKHSVLFEKTLTEQVRLALIAVVPFYVRKVVLEIAKKCAAVDVQSLHSSIKSPLNDAKKSPRKRMKEFLAKDKADKIPLPSFSEATLSDDELSNFDLGLVSFCVFHFTIWTFIYFRFIYISWVYLSPKKKTGHRTKMPLAQIWIKR